MTIKQPLTKKQEDVLNYTRSFIKNHGHPPTLTELAQKFSITIRSVAQRLESLERRGYLVRHKSKQRGIQLLDNVRTISDNMVRIPVIASAGCDAGEVYAQERFHEFISIDRSLVHGKADLVAIKALGNSMLDAGIHNGDYVLVEVVHEANDGDRVVAVIGDKAVIKRFRRTPKAVVLEPESSNGGYEPMILRDDFQVFGKVLSVIPMQQTEDVAELEYEDGYRPFS